MNDYWYGSEIIASGYANHREEVERFIDELAKSSDPNSIYEQDMASARARVNVDNFTSDEIEYIEKEVGRRWFTNSH